jgi:hypothetical protein
LKKPFAASEFGKSSICLHLSLADPARREELSIATDGVTRLNQQIDRFSDLINAANPCPILT